MTTVAQVWPGVGEYPPGGTFGPWVLRDYELVWLLQGEARWYCGDIVLPLRPGQLLLARPGMVHRFVWDEQRPTRHGFAHFLIDSALPGLGPPASWPLVRDAPPGGLLDALTRYLLRLAGEGRAATQDIIDEVLGLLVTAFVHEPPPDGTPPTTDPVGRAVEHVRTVWMDSGPRPMTLEELSVAASVSRGYLSRLFRARFGMGAVATFERVRLARSATMLLRSNLTVAAVAAGCGFADPYHFSRRFRIVYGVSPRAFRTLGIEPDASERSLGGLLWGPSGSPPTVR